MTLSSPLDGSPLDGSPLDEEDLRSRVQKCLDGFLSRQAAALGDVADDLGPLSEAAADLLAGGKRLRPAFCYWGWRASGGPDCDEIVAAATSLEMFHAAALIHDDVMDDSDTRRGLPAAHRRFSALHRAGGWTGDPDRFGAAAAILLGDLCLTWSDELLTSSGLPEHRLTRGRDVFDVMRTQLMSGQYLDMLGQVVGDSSIERARRVIRYKSAKYTVEQPLLLGAALADAPSSLLSALSAYGLPLGEAFQLRDDVLGVFGDPAQTGKPAGDDLREGKRTVLVAMTLERATDAQRDVVHALLGDRSLDAVGVDTLRDVVVTTGALTRVEALIASLVDEAAAALRAASVDEPARDLLGRLLVAATERSD